MSDKDRYIVPVLTFLSPELTNPYFLPFKCAFTYNTSFQSYKSLVKSLEQTLSSFSSVETEVARVEHWFYFTGLFGRINEIINAKGCL